MVRPAIAFLALLAASGAAMAQGSEEKIDCEAACLLFEYVCKDGVEQTCKKYPCGWNKGEMLSNCGRTAVEGLQVCRMRGGSSNGINFQNFALIDDWPAKQAAWRRKLAQQAVEQLSGERLQLKAQLEKMRRTKRPRSARREIKRLESELAAVESELDQARREVAERFPQPPADPEAERCSWCYGTCTQRTGASEASARGLCATKTEDAQERERCFAEGAHERDQADIKCRATCGETACHAIRSKANSEAGQKREPRRRREAVRMNERSITDEDTERCHQCFGACNQLFDAGQASARRRCGEESEGKKHPERCLAAGAEERDQADIKCRATCGETDCHSNGINFSRER